MRPSGLVFDRNHFQNMDVLRSAIDFLHALALHSHSLIEQAPYFWIFVFMTIESSFVPFPSEVVMIPAGYFAATGKVNFVLAFAAGLGGSLVGAIINYVIGYYGGRKVVRLVIGKKNDAICVSFFEKYGDNATLIGRFIPAVRQLISLPAGVFRMNVAKFAFYTGLGAGIWCLILMVFWYVAGENQELFFAYKYQFVAGAIVLALAIIYAKIRLIRFLSERSRQKGE